MVTKEHNSYESDAAEMQKEFWQQNLGGIQNFYDTNTFKKMDYQIKKFYLDKDVISRIEKISKNSELSIYIMMLSIMDILFYKYYGTEDLFVLSPMNRNLDNVVNEKNVVVIKSHLKSDLTYKQYLMYMKKQVLEAYSHQNYDYKSLMNQLSQEDGKTISKIILLSEQLHKLENIETNNYDFIMHYSHFNSDIKVCIELANGVYDDINLEYFQLHLNNILRFVLSNPDSTLSQIQYLGEEEIKKLVKRYNHTSMSIPAGKTAVHLLYDAAVKYKDQVAIQDINEALSYEKFVQKVDEIAAYLKQNGFASGMIVGIIMERNSSLIATIFAMWKIGVTYIPLDKEYPVERINFIIEDSCIQYIIASENIELKKLTNVNILHINKLYEQEDKRYEEILSNQDMAAYCIYTSGTTGKPKGVVIEHKNLTNFIYAIKDELCFKENETILALTTMSFDIFILEAVVPLMYGMRIVITADELREDIHILCKYIIENKISIMQMTPSKLKMLLDYDESGKFLENVNELLLGGEELTQNIYDRLRKIYGRKVYNLYGPTEMTIWSTVSQIHDGDINIGKPIGNTSSFSLVPHLN